MENKILSERYQLLEKIGKGGTAQVYKGKDILLRRPVAVKILRERYVDDPDFRDRFRQEAQSLARLLHPNIVNVYDYDTDEDVNYIVMEYVEGPTLKEFIHTHGALHPSEAISIVKAVAEGLSQAHKQGIIHCDVKSQNILVTSEHVPKLTDFGIAQMANHASSTGDGDVMGSVNYISPEQACGQPLTPSSDLYSLGVVFFELLTGTLPYTGRTPDEIAEKHVKKPVPSLREFNRELPDFLDKIMMKALAKKPEYRYHTAQEFISDLNWAEAMLNKGKIVEADTTTTLSPMDAEATRIIRKTEMPPDAYKKPEPKQIQGQDNGKQPKKKKSYFWVFAVVFLALAIVGYMAFMKTNKQVVQVPDLVGKPVPEIQTLLTNSKLEFTLAEEFSEKIPSGRVCRQNPAAGSQVREGRRIQVFISKGTQEGALPNFVGKTLREALNIINARKIPLGAITNKQVKDKEKNIVLEQSVAPMNKLQPNEKLTLVINADSSKVVVPPLVGMKIEEARKAIAAAGLTVGKIEEHFDANIPEKHVATASPDVGAVVDRGATIDLNVSKGVHKGKNQIVEFIVPGRNTKTYEVSILVLTEQDTKKVYTRVHRGKERIRQQVEVVGKTRVRFYVDGNLAGERTFE